MRYNSKQKQSVLSPAGECHATYNAQSEEGTRIVLKHESCCGAAEQQCLPRHLEMAPFDFLRQRCRAVLKGE